MLTRSKSRKLSSSGGGSRWTAAQQRQLLNLWLNSRRHNLKEIARKIPPHTESEVSRKVAEWELDTALQFLKRGDNSLVEKIEYQIDALEQSQEEEGKVAFDVCKRIEILRVKHEFKKEKWECSDMKSYVDATCISSETAPEALMVFRLPSWADPDSVTITLFEQAGYLRINFNVKELAREEVGPLLTDCFGEKPIDEEMMVIDKSQQKKDIFFEIPAEIASIEYAIRSRRRSWILGIKMLLQDYSSSITAAVKVEDESAE